MVKQIGRKIGSLWGQTVETPTSNVKMQEHRKHNSLIVKRAHHQGLKHEEFSSIGLNSGSNGAPTH
eukprot:5143996-Amphidinium_carterae.1